MHSSAVRVFCDRVSQWRSSIQTVRVLVESDPSDRAWHEKGSAKALPRDRQELLFYFYPICTHKFDGRYENSERDWLYATQCYIFGCTCLFRDHTPNLEITTAYFKKGL